MNETDFDFLQAHSERFLEMAFRADRDERLHHPDAYGRNTGDCGDSIEIFLMIQNGRIDTVSFAIDGCVNTRASANMLGDMIEKKTVGEAWKIRPDDIASALETLPEASYHCAELAAGALYRALVPVPEPGTMAYLMVVLFVARWVPLRRRSTSSRRL
ncbi:MAG: iron-sulfur cluster assembly scaffold protein [Thermodesulfobacteriota bacterium]